MSHDQATASQAPAPGRWWTCCDRIEKSRVDSFELELVDLFNAERKEHGATYAGWAMANRASGALHIAEICGASAELCGMLNELSVRLQGEFLVGLPEAVDGHAN